MTTDSPKRIVVIRAIVLGVLLTACVAGAALYVHDLRTEADRNGKSVVAEIRQKGLGQFIREPTTRWFLIQADRTPLGWHVIDTAPRPDSDGVMGLNLTVTPAEDDPHDRSKLEGTWERWELNHDATEGRYDAGDVHVVGDECDVVATTSIVLADGRVQATQLVDGRIYRSSATVPANYLPEGTMEMATRVLAGQDEPARFRMIVNSIPPQGDAPRFFTLTMRNAYKQHRRRPGTLYAVQADTTETELGHSSTTLFDAKGQMMTVIFGGPGGPEMNQFGSDIITKIYGNPTPLLERIRAESLQAIERGVETPPAPAADQP